MTVAERISNLIDDKGMKQKFIAQKIDVSETAMSAMLSGKQKIDVETFIKICFVLGTTPDELCEIRKGA